MKDHLVETRLVHQNSSLKLINKYLLTYIGFKCESCNAYLKTSSFPISSHEIGGFPGDNLKVPTLSIEKPTLYSKLVKL